MLSVRPVVVTQPDRPKVFVLTFDGDMMASQVGSPLPLGNQPCCFAYWSPSFIACNMLLCYGDFA